MRRSILVALAAALLAAPAFASFDVEIPFETAYAYYGSCAPTGQHGSVTVPRCSPNNANDGGFVVRTFTRVLSGAATVTLQSVRLNVGAAPGASPKNICVALFCTATTPGGTVALPLSTNAGALLSYNIGTGGGDANCGQNKECDSGAASPVNVRNQSTGADCVGTACNNSELICTVQVNGSQQTNCTNGYYTSGGTIDLSSMKLTVGP